MAYSIMKPLKFFQSPPNMRSFKILQDSYFKALQEHEKELKEVY